MPSNVCYLTWLEILQAPVRNIDAMAHSVPEVQDRRTAPDRLFRAHYGPGRYRLFYLKARELANEFWGFSDQRTPPKHRSEDEFFTHRIGQVFGVVVKRTGCLGSGVNPCAIGNCDAGVK